MKTKEQACKLVSSWKGSYSYNRLLEKHSLEETGTWKVVGEDPNCDFNGPHHQPHIGIFEGTLKAAIVWAVCQPGFFNWGGGGDITKENVKKVSQGSFSKSDVDEIFSLVGETEKERQKKAIDAEIDKLLLKKNSL